MNENDAEAVVLDVRGLTCPLPVMRTEKAVRRLGAGARLMVEASDPLAEVDIPHYCRTAGHRLIAMTRADGFTRFLIETGERQAAASAP